MALLYSRRLSIHVTRWLVPTRITPDQVTFVMMFTGLLGAAALAIPGVLGAVLACLGIQLYLLLDCVDGELARWRATTSARGVYIDRLSHYVVEAALLSMFGLRVGDTWNSGWLSVGLLTAVLALVAKAESDLVGATVGPTQVQTDEASSTPRSSAVRRARALLYPLKVHRATGAVEASLLMLVAAVSVEAGLDDAERYLAVFLLAVAVMVAIGHAIAILASSRLDAPPVAGSSDHH